MLVGLGAGLGEAALLGVGVASLAKGLAGHGSFIAAAALVAFHLLVELQRRKAEILFARDTNAAVLSGPLPVEFLVDDVLRVWHEVQSRAGEFVVVVGLAVLAVVDLELIGNVAALIAEEAVQLVVHVAAPEGLNESLVVESVK